MKDNKATRSAVDEIHRSSEKKETIIYYGLAAEYM